MHQTGKILLTDIQYIGSINWIKSLITYSHVKIDICENWQKGAFMNRMSVAGAGGRRILTVPIQGGRDQHAPLSSVKIAYKDNWPEQHIRTLESCYRRSPFYEYYSNSIYDFLRSRPEYLVELNLRLLEQIRNWVFPEITISTTRRFELDPGPDYHDRRRITIGKLVEQDENQPVYRQVFEDRNGFISGLSILDLLFCTGPTAKTLLKDCV